MPVNHRFLEHNFGNGFQTHNAVLDTVPYEPEVLFIGTFNPGVETNPSDFFYSRNYFWRLMNNLFHYHSHELTGRRVTTRGKLLIELSPSTDEIFRLCIHHKMVFADLIKSINVPNIVGYKDDDLSQFCKQNLCQWSTEYIKEYLENKKSISKVYLTRQATGVWGNQWNSIKNKNYGRNVEFYPIYTPSGQGLSGKPRHKILLCHWLFNKNYPNYDRLNYKWLIGNGVDVESLRRDCEKS